MRMFNLPINDERLQSMTEEQMNLMLMCDIASDPERLAKFESSYYDPEFDEELNSIDSVKDNPYIASYSSNFDTDTSSNDKLVDREIEDTKIGNNDTYDDYDEFEEV